MSNDFIEYYGENKISPVHQDISDINLHYRRRQKLYRQCGIPTIAFKNAQMLEVGPGGGHNALAPLHWGVEHLDLVEPNPTGVETLEKLFSERGIEKSRYTINHCAIEDFQTDKKYDIIVAEGFMQYVSNQEQICSILSSKLDEGGVMVITCADDVSGFIELMKRMIGHVLTRNEATLREKVNMLIPVFDKQLESLRGVSRPTKDWIEDNIFNPTFGKDLQMTMMDAVGYLSNLDLLGSSPRIFTDYSWYKDVWFPENESYKEQFNMKRMGLVMAGLPEQKIDKRSCASLSKALSAIKREENEFETDQKMEHLYEILRILDSQTDNVKFLDESFVKVYNEITAAVKILADGQIPDMSKYPALFGAFGRNQQYISFMKTQDIF